MQTTQKVSIMMAKAKINVYPQQNKIHPKAVHSDNIFVPKTMIELTQKPSWLWLCKVRTALVYTILQDTETAAGTAVLLSVNKLIQIA